MKQLPQFNLSRSCDQAELEATKSVMEPNKNAKLPPIEIPIEVKKSAAAAKRHTISRGTLQSYVIANKVELIHLSDNTASNNNKLSSSSSSSLASSSLSNTSISSSKQQQRENTAYKKPISHTWTQLDFKASRLQQQRVKEQQRLIEQQRQEDELKLAEFLFNSKRSLNTLLVSNSSNISRSLESLSSSSLQSPLSSLSSSSFSNNNNSCTNTLKIKTTLIASPDQSFVMSKATASISPNTSVSSSSGYALVDPNKIHLFVKGGQDGRSQGACPFCQDVFLQLLIKAQTNQFNFDVITINLENPPKEFKDLAIKPPVLIHGRNSVTSGDSGDQAQPNNMNAVILSDVDEIAEYLDRLYPNTKLTVENAEAKKVCLNVFSKFSYFIRDVSSKSTSLEAELEKIDNYLRDNTNSEHRFLNGKSLTALDCSLLPKLQHIRVAAESVKKFRIPYRFEHLWRYIKNAYETDAFQKSCPPDREIIWHWSKTNLSHKDILQIMQEQPYRTLSLPDDLKL